ncbi:MAG: leucine zipper domain-containing protein [Desulfobacterales bacterium]
MRKAPSKSDSARLRAELIMKVRCGIMTAREASTRLGVSRKTYYKWEERGLAALLDGVADQTAGRPQKVVDARQEELEHRLVAAQRQCALLEHKMALKDVLMGLKLETGSDRAKKK